MSTKVGVLGGTFDPIHLGHLILAEESRLQLHLQHVLFVPAGQPWMKADRTITSVEHRVAMVKEAIRGNRRFRLSLVDSQDRGLSYTVNTLTRIRQSLDTATEFYLILGSDCLDEFSQWRNPRRIIKLSTLAVFCRPGYKYPNLSYLGAKVPGLPPRLRLLAGPLLDISSTEIRARIANRQSIRYLVPAAVERYIREHNLYQAPEALPPAIEAQIHHVLTQLEWLIQESGALQYGDFTLSSGVKSPVYFDGRRLTYHPAGAACIGKALFHILRGTSAEAVGGLTMGADPIAVAVALEGQRAGRPLFAFSVRKEPKQHGTGQFLEGSLPADRKVNVAIVEDVITTGASVLKAIEAVEAQGHRVVKVLALVDRHQGGSDALRAKGYDVQALFRLDSEGRLTRELT